MPRLLLLAALLATASSCDSAEPDFTGFDGLSGDAELLAGTWVWERSFSCGDGSGPCQEFVPAPTATETLTFTYSPETSSHNGTVEGFFNGYPVGRTTYLVEPSSRSITLGLGGTYTPFGVSEDRLVISDAASDGEETTYRRR